MKQIINLETGVVIEREFNKEELAQNEKDAAEQEAKKAAGKQAEIDKAALLAKLGITADEAKMLLS
jgi:hypothetical protein